MSRETESSDVASPNSSLSCSMTDTTFLEFRDSSHRASYEEHREKQVSYRLFIAVFSFITALNIYFLTLVEKTRFPQAMMALRIIRLSFQIPAWMLCYRAYRLSIGSPIQNPYFPRSSILADCVIFIFTVSACFTLILRTYAGECEDGEPSNNCNAEAEYHVLPQDSIMTLMFGMLVAQSLIKCYHWRVLAVAWVISFVSVIVGIVLAKAVNAVLVLVICVCCGLILHQYERNRLEMYISLKNNEYEVRTRMQAENERQVIEMRSVEMRHLLGNVAHDLKTPMQSFVMELELVSKMIKRPASQTAELISYVARDVRQIVESLQNLTDTNSFMYMVINRAIDFAKSSSDRSLSPNLATINFVESIQWAVNMVKSKTSLVPVTFEPVPSYICPYIITDKQWLIENILCLISNAAKFTTTGSVTVRCELICAVTKLSHDDIVEQGRDVKENSSFSSSNELLIEVEDTGIGIPEEKRESMFQPFQQTMRMAGGTGLGLYSLRNRVDALKGSCGISDRRDGADGARIWFKIPYRPDEMEICDGRDTLVDSESKELDAGGVELIALPGNVSPDDVNTEFSPVGSITSAHILLADDSLTIRKSISRVLVNEGLSVDLAENGQMALEMMGLKRYDLVLMDLQMPVMDGLEAVRRLRKQESESGGVYHQKVIGISAYTGEPYCSDAIDAGMDGFIEKPFSAKRFMELCSDCGIDVSRQ